MEPAAILIAAFQIHVGGLPVAEDLRQDGGLRGAGLKPDVDDVHLLAEGGAAAVGAAGSGRDDLGGGTGVPGVGALARKQIDDGAVGGGVFMQLAADFAEKHRDGNAPDALARDAPVGTGGDHVGDALFAPGRVPADAGDFAQSFGAQGSAADHALHGDEPLLGGAEDDRLVAAPAVRIGVLDVVTAQQHAAGFEQLDDGFVGGEDFLAVVLGKAFGDVASGIDAGGGIESVLDAGVEVVGAVGGSGVNRAGALVHGDVVGQHAEDVAVEEGMGEDGAFELRAGEGGENIDASVLADAKPRQDSGSQFGGEEIDLAGRFVEDGHVLGAGMEGDGHGGRQGPGRGGPDDGADLAGVGGKLGRDGRGIALERVLDVDAGAGVVGVLDLGLGQRGAVSGCTSRPA